MAIEARTAPPDLDDASRYVLIRDVPVVDIHMRSQIDPKTGEPYTTVVGKDQLQVIVDNTNKRADGKGLIPAVRIGHIMKDRPETDQPPIVGYMRDFKVGELYDKPTILTDVYMKRSARVKGESLGYDEVLESWPRRSIEVFHKTAPDAYIDALALLIRAPERDLGLLTYAKSEDIEILQCPYDKEKPVASPAAPPPAKKKEAPPDAAPANMDKEPKPAPDDEPAMEPEGQPDAPPPDTDPAGSDMGGVDPSHERAAQVISEKVVRFLSSDPTLHAAIGRAMAQDQDFLRGLAVAIGGILDSADQAPEMMDDAEDPAMAPGMQQMGGGPPGPEAYSAASVASGTNTNPPAPVRRRGQENMGKDMTPEEYEAAIAVHKQVNANQAKELAAQKSRADKNEVRITELELYRKEQAATSLRNARRSQLELLSRDFDVNVDRELELYGKLDDETFGAHVASISESYRPRIDRGDYIQTEDNPRTAPRGQGQGGSPQVPESQGLGIDETDYSGIDLYYKANPMRTGESPPAYGSRMVQEFAAKKKAERLARK